MTYRATPDFTMPPPEAWMEGAACRDYDAELWFPLVGSGPKPEVRRDDASAEAVRICRTECPFAAQCLARALRNGERFGIWGGVDAESKVYREALKEYKRPPSLPPSVPPELTPARADAIARQMMRRGERVPPRVAHLAYQRRVEREQARRQQREAVL